MADRSDWTPKQHAEHANAHLAATSHRKDIHWVVRHGRVVCEWNHTPHGKLGESL
jgi:endonuclease III